MNHLGADAPSCLSESGQNYAGRRTRIRPQLECLNCAVVATNDEIGESSTGVDSDAHLLSRLQRLVHLLGMAIRLHLAENLFDLAVFPDQEGTALDAHIL